MVLLLHSSFGGLFGERSRFASFHRGTSLTDGSSSAPSRSRKILNGSFITHASRISINTHTTDHKHFVPSFVFCFLFLFFFLSPFLRSA